MKAERSCAAPELAFWKEAICERRIADRSRASGFKWHGSIDARVAATGAGKSGIFDLLVRLRPVISGKIRFESQDLAAFSAQSARHGWPRAFVSDFGRVSASLGRWPRQAHISGNRCRLRAYGWAVRQQGLANGELSDCPRKRRLRSSRASGW
jgi:hypothetical protein